MKPRFSVYPEKKKSDKFPQPGLFSEETSAPRAGSAEQPVGWPCLRLAVSVASSPMVEAGWLTPCTDPSDHWQPNWWVSSPPCSHILHADLQEVPGWLGSLGCSPTKHILPPCALQFLQPISARESPAAVLRQQSLRKLVHTTGRRAAWEQN